MIKKDKVFIIASNVDDSIKSASAYYDLSIFKNFESFEKYVEVTPISTKMIIINSKDLRFSNSSMNRIINIINSTFLDLSGFVYYMVDDYNIKGKIEDLCKINSYDKLKCIYTPTLHAKDVSDILSGELLTSAETVTFIKTYRMRASDYIRSQNAKESINFEDHYESDEDELSNINNEEVPEDLRITEVNKMQKHFICSNSLKERSAWVLMKAQYLSMLGKTFVIEKDYEYHTLYDMLSKLDISYDFYDIKDIFRDCSDVINQIKQSKSKLIFVGSVNRIQYNYDVLISILIANLESDIDHFIYEATLSQIPYGAKAEIIMPTTVPEVLKCVNEISSISSYENIHFIGVNLYTINEVNITEHEFKNLLIVLLQDNNIKASVAKMRGLLLRKEIGIGGIFMHN